MRTSATLSFLSLLAIALADGCYVSTTTVPHPALSCTPFNGPCPKIICVDSARPRATVTVPKNYPDLITSCASVPVATSYGGKCTTDCGPITCPTLTVTKTAEEKKSCCTGY